MRSSSRPVFLARATILSSSGVGNFHRAHQAVYLDALFNTGHDLDWALIGAGLPTPSTLLSQVSIESTSAIYAA